MKPNTLKAAVKHAAIAADRHNMNVHPDEDPAIWARTLTTGRVADLFLTLPGLNGHWMELQLAINAGNNHFFRRTDFENGINDGGKTSEEGKQLITWISDAVIAAAKKATFDFPEHQLRFTNDMGWLKISRVRGNVIVKSTP